MFTFCKSHVGRAHRYANNLYPFSAQRRRSSNLGLTQDPSDLIGDGEVGCVCNLGVNSLKLMFYIIIGVAAVVATWVLVKNYVQDQTKWYI